MRTPVCMKYGLVDINLFLLSLEYSIPLAENTDNENKNYLKNNIRLWAINRLRYFLQASFAL